MQKRNLIVLLLVTVALCGAAMYFFNQAVQVSQGVRESKEETQENAAQFFKKHKAKTPEQTPGSTIVYKTNQFSWRQVESADYRQYIANLRAIGCPEATIRDIILTDVMRLYAARRGQYYHNGKEFKFWETDEKRKLKSKQLEEREKQLAAIDKEIPVVLRELLGINYEREINKYFVDTDNDNRRLSFLSQDKRDAVLALRDEIEGMRERITNGVENGNYTDADLAQLKKIDEYRQQRLGQLLSGPELQNFELATSETADRLRRDLVGFNPTEDEFREMFRLQKEHDDKYAFISPDDANAQKEKEADQERIEADILSKLDVNRAQQYEVAKNADFRSTATFTEVYDLPPSTTQSLFDIEQAVKQEKEKLLTATNISDEVRAEGLKAMQNETEKEVRKILGDQLYPKFAQSAGGWIQHVAN